MFSGILWNSILIVSWTSFSIWIRVTATCTISVKKMDGRILSFRNSMISNKYFQPKQINSLLNFALIKIIILIEWSLTYASSLLYVFFKYARFFRGPDQRYRKFNVTLIHLYDALKIYHSLIYPAAINK